MAPAQQWGGCGEPSQSSLCPSTEQPGWYSHTQSGFPCGSRHTACHHPDTRIWCHLDGRWFDPDGMLQPGGHAVLHLPQLSPSLTEVVTPNKEHSTTRIPIITKPCHVWVRTPRAQPATCTAPKLFCPSLLLSSGSWPPPCLSVSKTKSYYAEWISLEREEKKKEGGWWKRNNFCEGLLVLFCGFFFSLIPLGASL